MPSRSLLMYPLAVPADFEGGPQSGVAQSAEHLPVKEMVVGSSPTAGAKHLMTWANSPGHRRFGGSAQPHNGWRASPFASFAGMAAADLHPLARSFERHLRASNRSARTVGNYLDSIRQLQRSWRRSGGTWPR